MFIKCFEVEKPFNHRDGPSMSPVTLTLSRVVVSMSCCIGYCYPEGPESYGPGSSSRRVCVKSRFLFTSARVDVVEPC